jgi:hypothetical protein
MQRVIILVFIFILARGVVSAQSDTLHIQVGMNPVKTYLVSQIDSITFYVPITDIETDGQPAIVPEQFALLQNYPNPFNPKTVISYQLPAISKVVLKVYDILGNEVALLVNEVKTQGVYNVEFNAKNLASGIYFYRLQVGDFSSVKKLIIMK